MKRRRPCVDQPPMNSCLGAKKKIRLAEELPSPWSSQGTLGIGDESLPALSIPFTRWMRDSLQSHNSPVPLFLPSSPISLTRMRHASIHAAIHSITTSCFQFLKSQGPVLGAQAWQGSNWAPPIQGQRSDDSHQGDLQASAQPVLQNTHGEVEHVLREAFWITHQVNILIALFICWQMRVIDARLRRLATDLNVSFLANLNAKMGISQCF